MSPIKAEFIDTGTFTPREVDIAALVAEGWSDKDIARKLEISSRTVASHNAAIYQKMDLRRQSINTRAMLIITLVARGMIKLSVNSVVAALIFSAAQPDLTMVRVRRGNSHHHVQLSRRASDA